MKVLFGIWHRTRFYQGYLITLLLFASHSFSIAQHSDSKDAIPRYFEGLYLGTTLGVQTVSASISVNDVLVSEQQSRLITAVVLGHRWQFINDRVTFSFEIHAGFLDANLQTSPLGFPNVSIGFSNNSQVGLGYDIGYVVSPKRDLLVYLYIRQIRRTYQVTATDLSNVMPLSSESVVSFRYGFGAEYTLTNRLNGRLTLGTFSANLQNDFPKFDQPEASLGIIYQF